MRFKQIVIALLAFACCSGEGFPHKTACSEREAFLAEGEASSLKTWDAVYASFQQFSQCDDASISEGYSDSIVRLLSERWSQTQRLQELTQRDREFETFVVRHIDELMSPQQDVDITQNAEKHCPEGAQALCEHILKRIRETPCPPCADILKRRGETPWPESTPTTTR